MPDSGARDIGVNMQEVDDRRNVDRAKAQRRASWWLAARVAFAFSAIAGILAAVVAFDSSQEVDNGPMDIGPTMILFLFCIALFLFIGGIFCASQASDTRDRGR